MNPAPEREEALFEAALRLSAPDRAAFLSLKCAGDPALRRRLDALLTAHDAPHDFMAAGATKGFVRVEPLENDDEAVGQTIGRYKLLEKLGEGGCGVVYVAEQSVPIRRRVALKVIKLGMDTKQVVARFDAERQALALMDHPNIAKVLDASATERGRPYFVMELVRGIRITDYCDQNHLSTRERLDLFIQVCHAIQHAHQKGIIHRDIKPSNILLTLHDGVPVPKVIDFGIAKATEGRLSELTVYTQLHQLIGTPAYMSPEQAEMSALDVDTRSDIYGLGVLLYELLVGRTPFDGKRLIESGLDAMRRTIREQEPLRPSTRLAALQSPDLSDTAQRRRTESLKLVHLLRGDLDWIVMKCLEKDRTRRYETANGLAMDIQRHLNDEPVIARPPSKAYRFAKTVRRHTGAFAAVALFLAALLLGIVISLSQMFRAQTAEERAQRETDRARTSEAVAEENSRLATEERIRAENNLYAADMTIVQQALSQSNLRRARERLAAHIPKQGGRDLRGWEWYYFSRLARGDETLLLQTTENGTNATITLSSSPLLNGVLLASANGKLDLWDFGTLRANPLNIPVTTAIQACVLDAFGEFIALQNSEGNVSVWHIRNASTSTLLHNTRLAGRISAFSPTNNLLAFVAQPAGRWELPGSDIGLTAVADATSGPLRNLPQSGALALFSRNGQTLITGTWKGTVHLWNTSDWTLRQSIPHLGRALHMALSPDDRWLLVCSFEGIFLCDLSNGQVQSLHRSNHLRATHAAFNSVGTRFSIAYSDGTIGLWDFPTRKELGRLKGHESAVHTLAFSPDGNWLMSADRLTETVRIFRAEIPVEAGLVIGMFSPPVFSHDGRMLAVTDSTTNGYVTAIWNLTTHQKKILPGAANPIGFSADGNTLITATVAEPLPVSNGRISGLKHWNVATGELTNTISFRETNHLITAVVLSPNGNILAAGDAVGNVLLWDARTGAQLEPILSSGGHVWNLAFSPDSQSLAVGIVGHIVGHVVIWDLQNRKELFRRAGLGLPIAFSPDGKQFAMSTETEILLLDARTGALVQTLSGHRERVYWLAFSPDGRTLASAAEDLKLWSLASGRDVANFETSDTFLHVSFSPDGSQLIGGPIGRAYLWSASTETPAAGR